MEAGKAMLRVGTSGWVYQHWRGIFYPEPLRQRDWLAFYIEHFDTVEINNSFYRLPSVAAFTAWRESVPAGFRYAVKGSRFITHLKRLSEPEEHVALFFERLQALSDRAGPVLWQLPPSFQRDDGRLARFLEVLPPQYQHTIEFRHGSWLVEEVFTLLEGHGVALCIPHAPGMPHVVRLTTSWTYLRFHHGNHDWGYAAPELDGWATLLRSFLEQGIAVWAYFNNDPFGHAIRDAQALRARLTPS